MTTPVTILAIDPGPTRSAVIWYRPSPACIFAKHLEPNDRILQLLHEDTWPASSIAIEMIACYGMPVGREVFETCVWIGRFVEALKQNAQADVRQCYRQQVKLHLCQSARAKDANVRQAILDLFPSVGKGAVPQIGTKADPGPLYGISNDLWAALGVAITAAALWPSLQPFCVQPEHSPAA